MTAPEIFRKIEEHLDMTHKQILGNMRQDPYRSDLFKLFAEAYRNRFFDEESEPLLTGDAILVKLERRWVADNEERRKLLWDFTTMWNDWRYAWDKHP